MKNKDIIDAAITVIENVRFDTQNENDTELAKNLEISYEIINSARAGKEIKIEDFLKIEKERE